MCCLFFPINVFFFTKTVSTMHRWFLQHFGAILKSGGSTAVVIEAFYFLRLASLQIVCMVYSFFWLYKMTLKDFPAIFVLILFGVKELENTKLYWKSPWQQLTCNHWSIPSLFNMISSDISFFLAVIIPHAPGLMRCIIFFQDRYSCAMHRYSL